jgi:hypothetical protein
MTREALSSIDRAWLRMEDPTYAMMITILLHFDAPIPRKEREDLLSDRDLRPTIAQHQTTGHQRQTRPQEGHTREARSELADVFTWADWYLPVMRVLDHPRRSIHCALLSARFTSTISASRAAAGFIFSRTGWVQFWLLRAQPIAAMASTVSGMSAVCHKEGTGPCKRDAHYRKCFHQRR